MLGEPRQDTSHVLEPIPTADLQDDARVRRYRAPLEEQSRMLSERAPRPVAVIERDSGRPFATRVDQTCPSQRRRDLIVVEGNILGTERIERRGDDEQTVTRNPARRELFAREDERLSAADELVEERPARLSQFISFVSTDVTPPDNVRTDCPDSVNEPGGLGIMEHHDITGLDHSVELLQGSSEHLDVNGSFRAAS